jgi:hypothetical protein
MAIESTVISPWGRPGLDHVLDRGQPRVDHAVPEPPLEAQIVQLGAKRTVARPIVTRP